MKHVAIACGLLTLWATRVVLVPRATVQAARAPRASAPRPQPVADPAVAIPNPPPRTRDLAQAIAAPDTTRGVDTGPLSPRRLLEGKVTAVSPEIGLIILSIGRWDGVVEGNEFTVFRHGQFVAKMTIDRVDPKWSTGRVTVKEDDPCVADDASNGVFLTEVWR